MAATFTLVDDADGKFVIEGNVVKTAALLDYETATSYSITVAVSGLSSSISNQTFTIEVSNIEETIVLTGDTVAEDATVGTTVGTLTLSAAVTGTPVYSLADDAGGRFSIAGDLLQVAGALDYEADTSHSITVAVTGITPSLSNKIFTITVTDVALTVSSFSPADDATGVSYSTDLVATFPSTITFGTGNIYLKKSSDNSIVDQWDVVTNAGSGLGGVEIVSGTQLTMHLTDNLDDLVSYYINWDAGIVTTTGEVAGALTGNSTWNFTAAVPAGYDIFLTTGDSNLMTGVGADYALLDVADPDVKQLGYTSPNTNLVIPAQEPLDYASQGNSLTYGYIGHDQHFAADYYKARGHLKTPRQVLLVVDGIGGSAVSAGGAAAGQWAASSGSVGNPTAYGSELTLAASRLATALALTGTNQVKGVLDHEGVNNYLLYGNAFAPTAQRPVRADKYRFIQYLRNLLGPTVPIVLSRAAKNTINADLGAPYAANGVMVDNMLRAIPKHFPYTAIADSQVPTELLASGDGVHFSAPEQRILAERYYTAWLAAQSNAGRVVQWDQDCQRVVDGYTSGMVVSNGGLDVTCEGVGAHKGCRATGPLRSGKAYCEVKIQARTGDNLGYIGFCNGDFRLDINAGAGQGHTAGIRNAVENNVLGYTKVYAGVPTGFVVNDIIMLAADMTLGKAWIGRNGVWYNSGNPAAGTGEWISGVIDPIHICAWIYDEPGLNIWRLQPRASQFVYTPPTGFGAWQEDVPTPSVLAYFPADNATNVANAIGRIYARFNVALTFGSSGTISLKKTSDNSVVQTWNVATDQGYTAGKVAIISEYLLTLYLSALLGQGIGYYVVWDAGVVKNVESENVAALTSTTEWSFTSIDLPTLAPTAYSPADNATGVSVHAPYVVTFNTPIAVGTGTATLKKTSDNSVVQTWNIVTDYGTLAGKCRVEGSKLYLYPSVATAANTGYYIIWDAGVVTNLALEAVAAQSSTTAWNFTTAVTADLLLDQFTYGAVFSVRKLVTAYAGNCVRIRRSSDNAELDIGFSGGIIDTAAIATHIGGGTGHLVKWYDQGGNGINVTTASAPGQGVYTLAGPGSKPTFRFLNATTGEFYRINSVLPTSFMSMDEMTFFSAYKEDSSQSGHTLLQYFHTVSTAEVFINASFSDALSLSFGNNTTGKVTVAQPISWPDLWHVSEFYKRTPANSNEQGIYVDGILAKRETDKVGTFATTPAEDFTALQLRGDVSEFVTIKTGLDYDARTIIRHNMMTSYAIARPLVLDGHTVGLAYGLRRLRTNYTGNCIRIRRSSDSTEQDFGFVGDLVDTAGIATFVGGGSGFIKTWYDQSGSALDITNATTANQPLFVASGIGSKPTVRFDGTNDSLVRASVALATLVSGVQSAHTSMWVQKQDGTQVNNVIYYWTSTGYFYAKATMADNLDFVNGTLGTGISGGQTIVAQPTGWDNVGHVVEHSRDGATGAKGAFVDGVSLDGTVGTGAALAGTSNFTVGSDGTNFLKGDLSELFVIKVTVPTPDRVAMRANIGAYYGITIL